MGSNFDINNDCRPCRLKKKASPRKHLSFVSGILLALIPKCPFCFMAFSSTMFLCGEDGTHVTQHTFGSPATLRLTLLFCAVTLLCILLNYRDKRTPYALALSAAGAGCVITSVMAAGGLPLYYFGVLLVFGGVWLNGSLLYFIRKGKTLSARPVP